MEDYFFRHLAREVLDLSPKGIAYKIGSPSADLNFFNVINAADFENLFQRAQDFFKADGLSYTISMPENLCGLEIRSHLESIGARESDQTTEMAVHLGSDFSVPVLSDGCVIKFSDGTLKDWQRVLTQAFKADMTITAPYVQCHIDALTGGSQMRHLCLYQQNSDKEPIACLTLTQDHKCARIDDVGCLPAFQGKGYATTLIQQALKFAKDSGAQMCFLEASQAGYGTYLRCGFQPIGTRVLFSCRG